MTAAPAPRRLQKYGSDKILIAAVDPGWCATEMGGHGAPLSPAQGAETPVQRTTATASQGAHAPTHTANMLPSHALAQVWLITEAHGSLSDLNGRTFTNKRAYKWQ